MTKSDWRITVEYPNNPRSTEKERFTDPYNARDFLQSRAEDVDQFIATIRRNGDEWVLQHGIGSGKTEGSDPETENLDWYQILERLIELGKGK